MPIFMASYSLPWLISILKAVLKHDVILYMILYMYLNDIVSHILCYSNFKSATFKIEPNRHFLWNTNRNKPADFFPL